MTDVAARLRWTTGKQFVATSGSGHSLVIDVPVNWGGENSGPSNAELMLVALGGCAGMDIVSLLAKKRRVCERAEISVGATLADERPTELRNYLLTVRVWAPELSMSELDEVIGLSLEKYCVVAHSIQGGVACRAFLNGEPSGRYQGIASGEAIPAQ